MQNLKTIPETDESNNGSETTPPAPDELSQIAKLLSGEADDQDDQGTQDGDGQGDQDDQGDASKSEKGAKSETTGRGEKPKTLQALAEKLGVDVADLYGVEISFGDGSETKTLGEVKDAYAAKSTLEVDRLAWEEGKSGQEQELRKHAQDIADIVSALPRAALSKDLISRIQRQRAQLIERESRLLPTVIPEWRDETVETRDREAMRTHLTAFGFAENYLDNLVDSKTLALLRDATLRKVRVDKALEQVKAIRPNGHSSSPPPSRSTKKKSSRSGPVSRVQTQLSQVSELLSNELKR